MKIELDIPEITVEPGVTGEMTLGFGIHTKVIDGTIVSMRVTERGIVVQQSINGMISYTCAETRVAD